MWPFKKKKKLDPCECPEDSEKKLKAKADMEALQFRIRERPSIFKKLPIYPMEKILPGFKVEVSRAPATLEGARWDEFNENESRIGNCWHCKQRSEVYRMHDKLLCQQCGGHE